MVVVSLIVAVGGHWAILQSIAWFGMVVHYSQGTSLSVGIEKTFDGKHLCSICKIVKKGKESEQNSRFVKIDTKLELFWPKESLTLYPPTKFVLLDGYKEIARIRADQPALPPPKLA
jgi:hypothetical protein